MKKRKVTFKQIEDAAKQIYGASACLDIVEPVIFMPESAFVERVRGFDNNLALIIYKSKHTYDPLDDSKDLIVQAMKNGNIVIPIPVDECPFLYADSTTRTAERVCIKYPGYPFVIPQIDIPSIYDAEVSRKRLVKSNAKKLVEVIDNSKRHL